MKQISFEIQDMNKILNELWEGRIIRGFETQFDMYKEVIKTIFHYDCISHSIAIDFSDRGRNKDFLVKGGFANLEGPVLVIIRSYTDVTYYELGGNFNSILCIVPDAKLDAQRKSEIEKDYTRSYDYPIKSKVWDFEDLRPRIIEYSKYLSGFSHTFKDLTLSNAFNLESKKEEVKRKNINKYLLEFISHIEPPQLVISLGAGVSQSAELPNWDKLLESLMIEAIKENKAYLGKDLVNRMLRYYARRIHGKEKNNPLFEAEFIKLALASQFRSKIEKILHQKRKIVNSVLINTIINFILTHDITEVITYNFDNLIEDTLQPITKDFDIIYDNNTFKTKHKDKLKIYHVHGYLPEDNSEIILSESEYLDFLQKDTYWGNKIQKNHYTRSHCLLIGLSIRDQNLRRIMYKGFQDRISEGIYELYPLPHFAFLQRISEKELLSAPWRSKYIGKKESKKVLTLYHELKECAYLELGIHVIWYDSHTEIPEMLENLTNLKIRNEVKLTKSTSKNS